MSKASEYLEFFGSDALKRLHGCAIAEADRGAESPCHGLARPLRRPQVGVGNPHAPILFLSPSPIDPASTSNDAFAAWLDHESALQHHLVSETVQPYFRFVRAALLELRRRFGQTPHKHDPLDFAFHSWSVRCATENPDRVTEAAVNQCGERHLEGLLATINPRVIVAMGGPVARYFWWRNQNSWDQWKPMTAMHGHRLPYRLDKGKVPVVLSIHPSQRDVAHRPEVIGRAIADSMQPADLEPREVKAA